MKALGIISYIVLSLYLYNNKEEIIDKGKETIDYLKYSVSNNKQNKIKNKNQNNQIVINKKQKENINKENKDSKYRTTNSSNNSFIPNDIFLPQDNQLNNENNISNFSGINKKRGVASISDGDGIENVSSSNLSKNKKNFYTGIYTRNKQEKINFNNSKIRNNTKIKKHNSSVLSGSNNSLLATSTKLKSSNSKKLTVLSELPEKIELMNNQPDNIQINLEQTEDIPKNTDTQITEEKTEGSEFSQIEKAKVKVKVDYLVRDSKITGKCKGASLFTLNYKDEDYEMDCEEWSFMIEPKIGLNSIMINDRTYNVLYEDPYEGFDFFFHKNTLGLGTNDFDAGKYFYTNATYKKGLFFENTFLTLDHDFFHKEFSTRSIVFKFKNSNSFSNFPQMIYEEGGSVNGISFLLKDNNIILAIRDNYELRTYELPYIKSKFNLVQFYFNKGNLEFKVNDKKIQDTAPFLTVSRHPDASSLGCTTGTNAYDRTKNKYYFNGSLRYLLVQNQDIRKLGYINKVIYAKKRIKHETYKLNLLLGYNFNSSNSENIVNNSTSLDNINESNKKYIDLDNYSLDLHKEIKDYTILLSVYSKTGDDQFIYDEGGNVNGIGLRLKNKQLQFVFEDNAEMITETLKFKIKKWNHIIISKKGNKVVIQNNKEIKTVDLPFEKISYHPDPSGLGCHSTNSFQEECTDIKDLKLNYIYIYDRALNIKEAKKYRRKLNKF